MKKILFVIAILLPELCFAGAIGDAIRELVERSKKCDEISLQIKEAEEKFDTELLQKLKSEYDKNECDVKEIDGTGDFDEISELPADDETSEPKCDDGSSPDDDGCCPGEIYTDMGKEGFNCCPVSGGDCFPPIVK